MNALSEQKRIVLQIRNFRARIAFNRKLYTYTYILIIYIHKYIHTRTHKCIPRSFFWGHGKCPLFILHYAHLKNHTYPRFNKWQHHAGSHLDCCKSIPSAHIFLKRMGIFLYLSRASIPCFATGIGTCENNVSHFSAAKHMEKLEPLGTGRRSQKLWCVCREKKCETLVYL